MTIFRSPWFLRPVLMTALCLILLLLWDASGLDMALAQRMGTPWGFTLRDNVWLTTVMHQGGKTLSWLAIFALLAMVRWPLGPWRLLPRGARWQLALVPLVAVGVITLLKHASTTSCPWDLEAFGGAAPWVSHWALGVVDGGGGRCFPAGHAAAGFGFLGGWFVWRTVSARYAAAWLCAALWLGLVLGAGQQLRGAHFMSHTLWTAWICWTVGLIVDLAVQGRRRIHEERIASRPVQPNLNES